MMIAMYARRVALEAKGKRPDQPVTGVKVYRVIHEILLPQDMGKGASPTDETTYRPFFMGEFHWTEKKDPQTGKPVIDPQTGAPEAAWEMKNPDDPLLYWWIPIVREPDVGKIPVGAFRTPGKEELVLRDYLAVHAGDRKGPEKPRE
jgi:hypothetical protein